MRLGIDAREIQKGVYTGIGHPLANFLKYFSKVDGDDECVLFSSQKIPLEFGPKVKNIVLPENMTFLWDQRTLAKAIAENNLQLFYSPYYKIPLSAKCMVVSAILDLMYLIFPQYSKDLGWLGRTYYATFGKAMARKADRILTCSQYSKGDIVRIYGIDKNKIDVIPLSISNDFQKETDPDVIKSIKSQFGINTSYILYLGNFKPHKNVKRIIEAFAQIHQNFAECKLVLAGPKEYLYQEICACVEEKKLTDKVIFTGKLQDTKASRVLYSEAEVFVMPSFYEGFGLPPVEAMACGTPVVAANATSIPEVVRDAGILIDPKSSEEIAQAITKILKNDSLKQSFIDKGYAYAEELREERISKLYYQYFQNLTSKERENG